MPEGQLARSYTVTERILGTTDWARFGRSWTLLKWGNMETWTVRMWSLRERTQGGLEQLCSLLSLDSTELTGESQGSQQEPLGTVPGRRWALWVMSQTSAQDWSEDLTLNRAPERPLSSRRWHREGTVWALGKKRWGWQLPHSDHEMMGIWTSWPGSTVGTVWKLAVLVECTLHRTHLCRCICSPSPSNHKPRPSPL